jgi:uncharacterized membrane protein
MLLTAKRIAPWIVATLVIAVVVHLLSLSLMPRIVMAAATRQFGAPNTMQYGRRPDASVRTIVRPSTDLLYAICPYDLSKGPLFVTAPVPQGTYWSVAAYDADTNNWFVRDNQQVRGKIDIAIQPPWKGSDGPGAVVSPTEHGVIIIRTLIDNEAHLRAFDATRRQARCALMR